MRRTLRIRGFTLVELLVVITIIGILIALLLPAVQAAREAARRLQCANNFKQAGLALHNYHASLGCFPPAWFDSISSSSHPNAPNWFGWGIYLLPYVEQQNVYDMYDFSKSSTFGMWNYWTGPGANGGKNRIATATKIPAYLCPSDPTEGEGVWMSPSTNPTPTPQCGMTNMCAVSDSTKYTTSAAPNYPLDYPLNDGIFGANVGCAIADIKDGTSNTLMVGEVAGSGKGAYSSRLWAAWNFADFGDGINGSTTVPGGAITTSITTIGFSSYHPGGCNFAVADGSVGFVSQNTASDVLKALATRDGANRRNYTTPATESPVSGLP